MSSSTPSRIAAGGKGSSSAISIHHEQRRIGHICAILVRNLSLRPTRDRALQTLASKRPGGSNRYHTTSDDADLTLSLARSNSKGKGKADGTHRRRRSASWSRSDGAESSDDDGSNSDLDAASLSTSPSAKAQHNSRAKLSRGRSALLINHRRTSDHELTTSSSFGSTSDGTHSVEASPRPILKRASSTRDGRDARMHDGSPASTSNAGFLDELGANTTMLSRSDSRSSSRSSHTIRRPSHRARTTSMTSTTSVRSVRFDETQLGDSDGIKRPSRISGRLNAASRYALFSQKSLAQIMKDRMLECYVELSFVSDAEGDSAIATTERSQSQTQRATQSSTSGESDRVFYRTTHSKPGLHHSWGYQGGDPITPERDFAMRSQASATRRPLDGSSVHIKVWARTPPPANGSSANEAANDWKLVCQTSADLRDLEPLPGNLQDASLPLPPNAILLGLAPGANSLSGRARLDPSDTQSEAASHNWAETKEPKLSRKMSEREAERTRHVLESIIYYAVPIKPMPQTQAGETKNGSIGTTSLTDRATGADRKHGRDANPSRSPKLQRRTSREGYASDPENATSRKSTARSPEHSVAASSSASGNVPSTTPAAALTPDARRRERRKAFEDEQKRVLELSLRETKMMPSYTLDEARRIATKQAELNSLLDEVENLRQDNGDVLADQTSVVQLRLRRGQQQARNSAVREMIVDESDNLDAKRAELAQRRAALKARQQAMHASTSLFDAAEASSQQLRDEVRALTTTKVDTALQLHNQQASLLRDLETIFPIELSDASSLLFSICGLPLPNAVSSLPAHELLHEEKRWKATIKHRPSPSRPVFHHFDDDTISSALGLVAQLVVLLSTYLATPVHYPLATAGSRAVVQDGISLMSGPRAFPLYAKGMERYRYEYAAFLLNKDIEQLMNVHSVMVIDIRHTLPNLKNLMVTVAAAPPTSQLTRKSHIGKNEIALRSAKSNISLRNPVEEEEEGVANGQVKKGGALGIGLGLPSLTQGGTAEGGKQGKSEVGGKDTLVTTRVLGAPSAAATATNATASGAIASVSRAFSYFSGSTTR